MAGEWIPIDCNLGMKPEVLAISATTNEPPDVVIGRMVRLWAWAWHVTADGTIGVTIEMLPTVAGGDLPFWQAVEKAGWLATDGKSVTIPGWEERFSNAAKRRLLDARRKSVRRMSAECPHGERTESGRDADTLRTRGEEKRGEEKRKENIQARSRPADAGCSVPKDAICWDSSDGWQGITDADRDAWGTAYPAVDIPQELARADQWLKANPAKAKRKAWRRFVTTWLSRTQDRGGSRTGQGQPAATPKEARKFWRAAFDRKMTDAEYAAAMRARKATGSVSLDLSRKLTAEVKHAS